MPAELGERTISAHGLMFTISASTAEDAPNKCRFQVAAVGGAGDTNVICSVWVDCHSCDEEHEPDLLFVHDRFNWFELSVRETEEESHGTG